MAGNDRVARRPETRAASTNNSERTLCTDANTRRKNAGDKRIPKIPIEIQIEGPSTLRPASSTTIPGSAIRRLATQEEQWEKKPP